MSRTYTHPLCQNCISFDGIKNSCREQSSEFSAAASLRSIFPVLSISVSVLSTHRKTDLRNGLR